jgi:soluble lytic murein transglycosylase-like protein
VRQREAAAATAAADAAQRKLATLQSAFERVAAAARAARADAKAAEARADKARAAADELSDVVSSAVNVVDLTESRR